VLAGVLSILRILIKKKINEPTVEGGIEIRPECQVKPIFSSSFIQSGLAKGWDYNGWLKELIMLQNIGINETASMISEATSDVQPTTIGE
jgi:hypothetical protein